MRTVDKKAPSRKANTSAGPPRYFGGSTVASNFIKPAKATTFADLVRTQFKPGRRIEMTVDAFHALDDKTRKRHKDGPYILPATYPARHRARGYEGATAAVLVCLDVDDPEVAREILSDPDPLDGINHVLHHTISSTSDAPRLRLIVDADEIPLDRYADALATIAEKLGLPAEGFDGLVESRVAVQPMFLPVRFTDQAGPPLVSVETSGRAFTVDDITVEAKRATAQAYEFDGDMPLEHLPLPGIDPKHIADLLSHLDPDMSYPDWCRVICAIKHQFSGDGEQASTGFEIVDEWSAGGTKYDGTAATLRKWNSFDPCPKGRDPVTIKTVFDMAKKADPERFAEIQRDMRLAQAMDTDESKRDMLHGKPAVQLPGTGRPIGNFAAELGVLLAGRGVYARGGAVFKVDAGSQKLLLVDPQWLRTWAEQDLTLYKWVKAAKGSPLIKEATSMTLDSAKAVCASPQFIERLPVLKHYAPVRMPVMRSDGRIELLPTGYDSHSHILTDPKGCRFDATMPVETAKRVLSDLLAEFPFTDGRSRAAALAAMVTVFARGLLDDDSLTPAFLYLANAEGSGKTTAATLAGIPYGVLTVKPAPTREEEWQKRLLSLVMSGKRVEILDNVKGRLDSSSLEAYLTSPQYGDRILGQSQNFEGPADAVVLITGNGVDITPDMRRRTVFVEMMMEELRAEDRVFKRRLDGPAILSMQPEILGAMWALVRDWDEAGRPGPSRINSGFAAWSDIVGGIVEHAGFGCPTEPATIAQGGDTDTRDIATMGAALPVNVDMPFAELVDRCREIGAFEKFTEDHDENEGMTRSAKSMMAKILKRYHGRTIAPGRRFEITGSGHAKRYRIAGAAEMLDDEDI